MTIALPERLAPATLLALMLSASAWAQPDNSAEADSDRLARALRTCQLDALASAAPEVTVGEIRTQCERAMVQVDDGSFKVGPVQGLTALEARTAQEDGSMDRNYILTPHQPNYVMATYSDKVNQRVFEDAFGNDASLNREEVKFQISIKTPILRKPFDWDSDLFFGYTATSWWQLGNTELSNPFRETVYEPEVFLRNNERRNVLGLKVSSWDIGFNHQSNGQSGELSRSWNRLYGRLVFDLNDVAVAVRAWYRLPESEEDDDNPNEYRYLGYGDVRAVWAPDKDTYSMMYRQGTEGGAVELSWSRPISKFWRIYVQYWNGYGESLLDYNFRTERIGIGFALSDFLER